ncbi:MAG: hypothetical protein AB7Y46_09565 [Armatimonadota bacterium]
MIRVGIALLAVVLAAGPTTAETIEAGPFAVEVAPELTVRVNGQTLVAGDRCVSFQGMKPGEPVLVDPAQGRVLREGNVVTVLAENGRNTLRREVMVTPEAVHITFEMRVFGDTGGSHLQYDLLTPAEFLDGVEYHAWTGASRGPLETTTGTFSIADSAPSEYLVRSVRYIILRRPGAECSLDFNPDGAWVGESNYGHNTSTSPYHDGERFHFLMLCSGGRMGGIFAGKVMIRSGAMDYEAVHSTADVAYTSGFPVTLAVNFSRADGDGQYSPYAGDDTCRWRDPDGVRLVERNAGGLLYRDFATAAEDGGEGVLELRQRSGHYLLTLNIFDGDEDTGPFSVLGPDGPLFEDVTVERGEHWFRTAHLRFRDGRAELRFTGDWKVSALTLQAMLYQTEDFVLDCPFWNMAVEKPSPGQ